MVSKITLSLVSSVTVGVGGAASITFSSIPQDGTDLFVLTSTRNTTDVVGEYLQFNSTPTTYNSRILRGTGSTVNTFYFDGDFSGILGYSPASTYTSNTFGNTSYYVQNYSLSGIKNVSADTVSENNATISWQVLNAGQWTGTDAITSITLLPGGAAFTENSTASLYKITKGSDGTTVVT